METKQSQRRQFADWGREVGERLKALGLTIATAESCTGGTVASMLTQPAGSSAYFKSGVVSYAVSVKEEVLGVDVNRQGVVSEDTAMQMAEGVARVCGADCSISTTGIAGPTGAEPGKPVGTVCVAVLCPNHREATTFHFSGDREEVILQAADAALSLFLRLLAHFEAKS